MRMQNARRDALFARWHAHAGITESFSYCVCVVWPRLICMCDIMYSQVWRDMSHSHVWHDPFIFVTWHDQFICVTWHDLFVTQQDSFQHITWLTHMCDGTLLVSVYFHKCRSLFACVVLFWRIVHIHTVEEMRVRAALRKLALRMLISSVSTVFDTWRESAIEEARQRHVMVRIACRLTHGASVSAFAR